MGKEMTNLEFLNFIKEIECDGSKLIHKCIDDIPTNRYSDNVSNAINEYGDARCRLIDALLEEVHK